MLVPVASLPVLVPPVELGDTAPVLCVSPSLSDPPVVGTGPVLADVDPDVGPPLPVVPLLLLLLSPPELVPATSSPHPAASPATTATHEPIARISHPRATLSTPACTVDAADGHAPRTTRSGRPARPSTIATSSRTVAFAASATGSAAGSPTSATDN